MPTTCKTDKTLLSSYIDAGLILIPCTGLNKIPKQKGFLDTPYDHEYDPPENVSHQVLLKRKFLVIDCDPRHYNEGDKPLNRLFTDCGLDPDIYKSTFIVKTPSGGYHVYFTKHPDIAIEHTLRDYPGLEFKDNFIMAAGSYIAKDKDGNPVEKPYTKASKSLAEVAKAPDTLLAKLRKKECNRNLDVDVIPDSPADVSRFVRYCIDAEGASAGKFGDNKTFAAAMQGRSMGLSAATVFNVMFKHYNPKCMPEWTDGELRAKVQNAFQYARAPKGINSIQNEFAGDLPEGATVEPIHVKYQFDGNGRIKKSLANLKMLFKFPTMDQKPENKRLLDIPAIGRDLGFDQLSNRVVWINPAPWYKTSREWDDEDAVHYKMILSEQLHTEFPTDMIHEVAIVCSRERAFHPIRDYLQGCKWDGKERLDTWLTQYCGAVDSEYVRFVGRKTLVAAVARVFRPGCKFDHVLVFEGVQGMGKSFMWEIMASPWFTDSPLNIQDKSAVEVLQGKWVVELAEMEALSKYESQAIKGFLTRTEDRCRMAYGHFVKGFPRQCIFVGSLNPEQAGWLKDRTGNRRYWPVPVSKINLKALKEDKDQLWAEALHLFEKGEKIHVEDESMRRIMAQVVESRMQEDPWFGVLETHLLENGQQYVVDGRLIVAPAQLYGDAIGGGSAAFDMRAASRVMSVLKAMGFEKTRVDGKQGYVYAKRWEGDL